MTVKSTLSLGIILATGVVATGCVHVVEKEVIVEKPVYIHTADVAQTCSTAPLNASIPSDADRPLTMRGSAGALTSLPMGMLVATQMSMGIGPGMSLDERQVIEQKVQSVLESNSDGQSVRWVSRETGTEVNFVVHETQQEQRLVTVARGEEVGRMPDSMVVEPAIYVTTESVTLRPTPSKTSVVGGGNIPPGEKVKVLGRVTGIAQDSWMLVGGPDGTAFGYLEPWQVTPHTTNLVHPKEIYSRPTGARIRDSLPASVTCRTLSYGTDDFENVMRTCREPGGRWIAEPPVVDEKSSCRAKAQPPFMLRDF